MAASNDPVFSPDNVRRIKIAACGDIDFHDTVRGDLARAGKMRNFALFVTDGPAYGGSAPETCATCHVMDSQYENWYHAPHEKWTECVDCHLPHDNLVVYYLEKGRQGAKDVFAFTRGNSR